MIDPVLEKLEHIESDLISDRTKIDDILVRLNTIEERMKNIYERFPRLEDKQHDAVAEMVQPVLDIVEVLSGQLKRKKTITRFIKVNPIKENISMMVEGVKKRWQK